MVKVNDSLLQIKKKDKRSGIIFYSVFFFLIFLIALIFFLNTVVFLSIKVSGVSMVSTLKDGDYLIANKLKKVERGDIIIIDNVKSDYLIKRAIGLGGDTVEIKHGNVYLNGSLLQEDYLDEWQTTSGDGVFVLTEDQVFYLGDNRIESADSRVYGPCNVKDIVGVVEPWSVKNKQTLTDIFSFPERVVKSISDFTGCN